MWIQLIYVAATIACSEMVEWQNGIERSIDLRNLLAGWKDSILGPAYRVSTTLPQTDYAFFSSTTQAPTDIDDVAFLQELEPPEDSTEKLKTTSTIETTTITTPATFLDRHTIEIGESETARQHVFGVPFSIKIMKSQPAQYTTTRVRWRTVPSRLSTTTSVAPTLGAAQAIKTEMMNLKELMEKEEIEDLQSVCKNAKRLAHLYGIRDMPTFARKNCSLIRLYYPYATCEKVVETVDYCFSSLKTLPSETFV